ncbi:hypothetical protein LCGC14_1389160 [marine sediment metagenome]|uniref:Uncharacterized protein n=1 Tax=marine sediment metagenome TaxID=412755 RepID=A0A0F9KL92_9ZZZZ
MILRFESAGEFVTYDIDRENKKLIVSTSRTNYTETEVPWTSLYDPGKEKEQEEILDKLNDKDFKNLIIKQMMILGYELK